MLGGISLTAMRGVPVRELLERLGADEQETARSVPYRDFPPARNTTCMYGISGGWAYVLICLNANTAVNPSYLAYAPGDGRVYLNNFGDDLTARPQTAHNSKLAALAEALEAAGATCPDGYTIPQWHRHLDTHHGLVWQAVGDSLGIHIPRADVEQGRLPATTLSNPYG